MNHIEQCNYNDKEGCNSVDSQQMNFPPNKWQTYAPIDDELQRE